MNSYFDSLCETLDCTEDAFEMPFLERIRILALERNRPVSCIVSADQITNSPTDYSGRSLIVMPMFGTNRDDIGDVQSDFEAVVCPREDGARVSCFMLANSSVALTVMAPHWADMSQNDDFHILWLFDDAAFLTTYETNDDVNDSIRIVRAIEDDHNPLTQEEVRAWQNVAAQASYIGVFDFVDLRSEQ